LTKDIATTDTNEGSKKYYEALSYFTQNKFDEAAQMLLNLMANKKILDNEFFEKSQILLSKCYIKTNDYDNTIDVLKTFIKNHPESHHMKEVLFNVGLSYESLGEKEKARDFYNKLITIEPKDAFTNKAKAKLDSIRR